MRKAIHRSQRKAKTTNDDDERPATLLFWLRDGSLAWHRPRKKSNLDLSIGLCDSERAVGFSVSKDRMTEHLADFVLDKDQIENLIAFLKYFQLGRLKPPLGRKQRYLSFAAIAALTEKQKAARAKRGARS